MLTEHLSYIHCSKDLEERLVARQSNPYHMNQSRDSRVAHIPRHVTRELIAAVVMGFRLIQDQANPKSEHSLLGTARQLVQGRKGLGIQNDTRITPVNGSHGADVSS